MPSPNFSLNSSRRRASHLCSWFQPATIAPVQRENQTSFIVLIRIGIRYFYEASKLGFAFTITFRNSSTSIHLIALFTFIHSLIFKSHANKRRTCAECLEIRQWFVFHRWWCQPERLPFAERWSSSYLCSMLLHTRRTAHESRVSNCRLAVALLDYIDRFSIPLLADVRVCSVLRTRRCLM